MLEVDGRADVYALGVVLFEMLTGKLPFGGDSNEEVLMKQMLLPAPGPRSLVPSVPVALDAIVRRAMAKAPADRFANMLAFQEALLSPGAYVLPFAARGDEDAPGILREARPMTRAEIMRNRTPPVATPVKPAPVEPPPSAPTPRPRARAVSPVTLAVAIGLSLLVGGTIWSITRPPPTVWLTFTSDPDGATVVAPNGSVLGTTPLSIRVPRHTIQIAYGFQKPGFQAKTMSLVPDATSSVFVALPPLEPLPANAIVPSSRKK
jgi:serine/threonine protein kinase